MTGPHKHNWPQIIADMEGAGISHYKLGLIMHRPIAWVKRIARGQEPKHYEGEMLLMIHAEYALKMREIVAKHTDVSRPTFENEPSQSDKLAMTA